MSRNRDGYFVVLVVLVVAATLGVIYILMRAATVTPESLQDAAPAPSTARDLDPSDPVEILRVIRAPEADVPTVPGKACIAFKVKNVSTRNVAAVVTVALLDPDGDEIRQITFGVGRPVDGGKPCGFYGNTSGMIVGGRSVCQYPLRPGEYCIHLEEVTEQDYRRMAEFTATVELQGR